MAGIKKIILAMVILFILALSTFWFLGKKPAYFYQYNNKISQSGAVEDKIKIKELKSESNDWQRYSSLGIADFSSEVYEIKYPAGWTYKESRGANHNDWGYIINVIKNSEGKEVAKITGGETLGERHIINDYDLIGKKRYGVLQNEFFVYKPKNSKWENNRVYIFNTYENLMDNVIFNFLKKENDEVIAFQTTIDNEADMEKILATFEYIGSLAGKISDPGSIVSESATGSETKIKTTIAAPKIITRNKETKVNVVFDYSNFYYNSDYHIYSKVDFSRSLFVFKNTAANNVRELKYTDCKEKTGQTECTILFTPTCEWLGEISLTSQLKINTSETYDLEAPTVKVYLDGINKEKCDNGVDDNCDGRIDDVDPQCNSSEFVISVLQGEGLTNLARRSIGRYLEKIYSDSCLNKVQKVYAEDYIKKKLRDKYLTLKAGQKVSISSILIEEAISKAKELSPEELNFLIKYKKLVNYGAYRFVSKSASAKDEGSRWVVDDTGDIVLYYENPDVKTIYYTIEAKKVLDSKTKDTILNSIFTNYVELSNDGINWDMASVNGRMARKGTGSRGGGAGAGVFFVDTGSYNKGNLYIKFSLDSGRNAYNGVGGYGGAIMVLNKKITTNLDEK